MPDWTRHEALDLRPLAGVDLDLAALRRNQHVRFRVMASGEALPFDTASFDLITANMVVEHVAVPRSLFLEVARVLRPGGIFLMHTPNIRGYTTALTRMIPSSLRAAVASWLQQRKTEDVYPTHYRANSIAAMGDLADACGFRVRTLRGVLTSPQLISLAPLLLPEMLLIRALTRPSLAPWRPCLLVALERQGSEVPGNRPER